MTALRAAETSAAANRVRKLPGDVPLCITLGDVSTPIVELLAPRQPELHLGPASRRQVQPERNQGQALGPHDTLQLVDLGAVEEQLPKPLGIVIPAIRLGERGNVGPDQPRLVTLD